MVETSGHTYCTASIFAATRPFLTRPFRDRGLLLSVFPFDARRDLAANPDVLVATTSDYRCALRVAALLSGADFCRSCTGTANRTGELRSGDVSPACFAFDVQFLLSFYTRYGVIISLRVFRPQIRSTRLRLGIHARCRQFPSALSARCKTKMDNRVLVCAIIQHDNFLTP